MTKVNNKTPGVISAALSEYGMALVLLLLCALFSAATWDEQHPSGLDAAHQLACTIQRETDDGANVLIVVRTSRADAEFAEALAEDLRGGELNVVDVVAGDPRAARAAIDKAIDGGQTIDVVAANNATASWSVLDQLGEKFPPLADTIVLKPESYNWPNFLKAENLLNIANQIAVIAIIAVGMTLVIITAGIDLSVGSLIALSAVVTARLIRDYGGASDAGPLAMTLCCLAAVGLCGAAGAFNGMMVTLFRIPAFIVTLAMMLFASGAAYLLADGQSISDVPDSFIWLGRGADLAGIPNAAVLTLILYGAAHVLMTRMTFGRYIYAVGGNMEAARLSGVPVRRVVLLVYVLCGALAGLGGVVMASQLKSGAPTYGLMYELYVIAAVVVGGSSLMGGEGKVLGTLIGALIIAVIQNGMNLTGVESYTQKVVLGLVILGAVLADKLKRGGSP